ncbi:replication endonuclease [Sulfuriferula sp.]
MLEKSGDYTARPDDKWMHLLRNVMGYVSNLDTEQSKLLLDVAEPHHDATPHWHMLLFVAPEQRDRFREIIRHYALQDSPDEEGDEPGMSERYIKIFYNSVLYNIHCIKCLPRYSPFVLQNSG